MNHEMYLEMMRGVLDLHCEATHEEAEAEAVRRLEAGGCMVTCTMTSDHRFRVRVSGPGYKTTTTTSTSGYPVLTAFEKWDAWKRGER